MQQRQLIIDIQNNNLINIQDGSSLVEPNVKNKLQLNTCNNLISSTLKKKKRRQSGAYYQKCNLLKHHTSHLYIYIKENQYYLHWISDICFTWVV